MTELFNGGESDSFAPSDASCLEVTGTNTFDPNFARCALSFNGYGGSSASYWESAHWSPATDAYLHYECYHGSILNPYVSADTFVSLVNNAGTTVLRVRIDLSAGGTITLQYLNASSVWTSAGSVSLPATLGAFDLHWKFDASGELNFYASGTERITFSGDLSHLAGVAYVRLHNHFGLPAFSQIMVDTDPTIGHRNKYIPLVSAGATSSWTGTYTEIDEIVLNDADYINSATANQVSTFGITPPTLTGYTVQSITVSARANRDPTGPQNLELALRVSGTDYFSSTKSLTIGFAPVQNIWTQNPASAGAWSNSAAGAVQPGVKSIT